MYSYSSLVRYSEVDMNRKLDLTAIINYFQDCSTFHGEVISRGLDFLTENNRVWLMNAWQINIEQYPSLGDPITTNTWPYDFKSMYGYRNFTMTNQNGQVIAAANSIWVYYDTKKQLPAKITPIDVEGYDIEPCYDMEYAARKISIPSELTAQKSFQVVRSNIDTNNHVNNGQYVKMAMEFLPTNFLVKSLRAEYRISAVLGDIITPLLYQNEDTIIVVLANMDGKPYSIIEFKNK